MIRAKYHRPRPLRDREGYVVIEFGKFPDCHELPTDFTISVIGWGIRLLACGTDLKELAEYAKQTYGKVRVATGSQYNPLDMETAKW